MLRFLGVLAGGLVILAALMLGAFRLFAASLPGYKQDLQAWVADTLDLNVEYEGIDLRMGFAGPELAFFDAELSREESFQPFVVASRASVVIDPFALLFDRRLVPTRLVFDGIQVTLQRLPDGTFAVAGAPEAQSAATADSFALPEEVSLQVRDSEVLYIDEIRGIRWQFSDVRADVEQEFRAFSVSVSAEPPERFGERISVTADGFTTGSAAVTDDWRAFVALRGASVEGLTELWPDAGIESGTGDVSLWLQSDDGNIVSALADVAVEDVVIPYRSERYAFERIAFIGELTRNADEWSAILSDVNVTGPQGSWPRGTTSSLSWRTGVGTFEFLSEYVRLDDLLPLAAAMPASQLRDRYLALEPRGTLEDVAVRKPGEQWDDFEISGRFSGLGISQWNGFEQLSGFTGELRADTGGGTLELASPNVRVLQTDLLDRAVDVSALNGFIQWREGRDAIRILSDELSFEWLGSTVTGSGEFAVPHDGTSPMLDLAVELTSLRVAEVLPFVVAAPMDERLRQWLESSLGEGTLDKTDIQFYGPVRAFPFDGGEGEFVSRSQVSGGAVDYVPQWPRAEGFDGILEFRNASLKVSGRAQVLGNVSEDVVVAIADVRSPVLSIDANTQGPLGDVLEFLLSAPQIAGYLGPDYARLRAPGGLARLRLDLDVPLPQTEGYELSADLEVRDGVLALAEFGPQATEINGRLSLAEGQVSGAGIRATFLDGPAVADVEVPMQAGYRTRLSFTGEVSADSVVEAFDLPYGAHVAGQTRWEGFVLLPEVAPGPDAYREPTVVDVRSNLNGVALHFPAPFQKAPAAATNLGVTFLFTSRGGLEVTSHLGANRHFTGAWDITPDGFEFVNGIIAFGAESDRPMPARGLAIVGDLPAVDADEWLALSGAPQIGGAGPMLAEADLRFNDLRLWQQPLGPVELNVGRSANSFDISIDSAVLAGQINLPQSFGTRAPVTASLQRLYWQPGRGQQTNTADPRRWPGFEVDIEDFRLGMRRIGSVHARVEADPLGLRLVSFNASSPSLSAEGSGAWLVDRGTTTSRVAVSASSNDVASALSDFDLDPVLSGDEAELTAALRWPGGPAGNWLDHVSGDLSLRIAEGSMLDIEPGAGRLVGLMSIVALPRRLALDFRDVFNRGFVFDEISADFAIIDGNAFTDNLILAGPAAEIGVAGRTGLRDKDFRQQAIVTAEPGNMLPTVGGLIAGPGVGAALLIFTRIFKRPLRGIGRASYCITGSWDEPSVERLTAEQLEAEEICADLPPDWVVSAPAQPAAP
ncbi:MAG: YhdP family protein [Gammaproteobacteria bacterium]